MTAIRNGVWLDAQVFSEPAWVVPGIIPEGCCILAGRPKIGKSFLVLEIALAVAAGTQVLGVDVEQRPVLYLALEDNERRLQRRARALLDDEPLPHDFHCITRDQQQSAMELAAGWVRDHSDRKPLVIVDTLEKIRPKRGQSVYQDDYQVGDLLQSLLTKDGAVAAVHHTRKAVSEDFLDDLSGSLGLAGSVDTVITLKRDRSGSDGTLSVTGRDVEEMVYALTFTDGKWKADGESLAAAASKATEKKLSQKMQATLEVVNSFGETTAADVATVTDIKESTARQYLRRLCDEHRLITRIDTGTYSSVTASQVSHDSLYSKSTDELRGDTANKGGDTLANQVPQQELVLTGS